MGRISRDGGPSVADTAALRGGVSSTTSQADTRLLCMDGVDRDLTELGIATTAGVASSIAAQAVTDSATYAPLPASGASVGKVLAVAGTSPLTTSWTTGGGGAVSSVVGQTGDVTGGQIVADATVAAALAGLAQALATTAVKTADYTASSGELVPVNSTGGNVTITLPTGMASGKRVAVRRCDATANTVTVQRGGSDSIAVGTGTANSVTLVLQDRVVVFVSDGAGTWTPVEGYQALGAMDSRYLKTASNLSDLANAATARGNLGMGSTPLGKPATSLSQSWKSPIPAISGSWLTGFTLNTLYACPLMVWNAETWDRIGTNVNAAVASEVLRVGVYADGGTGYPGALIAEFGTIDCSSTGDKTLTIAQAIPAGMVWLAAVVQGASGANLSSIGQTPLYMPAWVGASTPFTYGVTTSFTQTGVSGSLPSNFTATVTPTGGQCPRVWVRVQ